MNDIELENQLRPVLGTGERLIWAGQPKKGIHLRAADAYLIPFSLLWGGFAIFWETTVIATGAPFLFKLWGIPFVVVGLYMIFGRFIADAIRRKKTIYGITSDRIIIRSGIFNTEIKSLNIRTLSDISFSQKKDGSGTITLGPGIPFANKMRGFSWTGSSGTPELEMIPDVKSVYDKLISIQRQVHI